MFIIHCTFVVHRVSCNHVLRYLAILPSSKRSAEMSNYPESSLQVVQQDTASQQRSLNRQKILEEDEYTEALSRIIARDFYPSLVHLEASNDYLDALRAEDPAILNASVRRLSRLQVTPTPYSSNNFPTPYGVDGLETFLSERSSKKRKYDESLSLDEFQARYTSEDNSSFTEILNEENKQRRERWRWAWDAQQSVEDTKRKQLEMRNRLLIEPSAAPGVRERQAIDLPEVAGLLTSSEHEEKENVVEENKRETVSDTKDSAVILLGTGKYGDSEQGVRDPLAKMKDHRSAGVDGWLFKAS
jgi:protein DGCR14